MRVLVARLPHTCVVPHLNEARYRFDCVRAARGGSESRQHLMSIAIPAAQQATVFELLRLAPELDDARDLDDFVCTANRIFKWTFRWNA